MRPLSLRTISASYTGMLTIINIPQRIICGRSCSATLTCVWKRILLIPPIKHKRFKIANVDRMVNMGDVLPNSITSCSYLVDKSSFTTLLVMANVVWENPNCLIIVSKKAKRYEVDLRIIHISWKFHQALSVLPQLRASIML